MSLSITSRQFAMHGEIPARHTCDGLNTSPPLSWSGVPPGTKSLALIIEDPDAPDPLAPKMTWVHWVLYNIPPDCSGFAEGIVALPAGVKEGINDWKRTGFGGPCPPIGRHRYFHKLYALATILPDLEMPTRDKLLKAMQGQIISQAELVGTYQRTR